MSRRGFFIVLFIILFLLLEGIVALARDQSLLGGAVLLLGAFSYWRLLLSYLRGRHEKTEFPFAFRCLELLLPRRLREEDLGDGLEDLARLRRSGAPHWQIRLKIASTVFWVLLAALHEVSTTVWGLVLPRREK